MISTRKRAEPAVYYSPEKSYAIYAYRLHTLMGWRSGKKMEELAGMDEQMDTCISGTGRGTGAQGRI